MKNISEVSGAQVYYQDILTVCDQTLTVASTAEADYGEYNPEFSDRQLTGVICRRDIQRSRRDYQWSREPKTSGSSGYHDQMSHGQHHSPSTCSSGYDGWY